MQILKLDDGKTMQDIAAALSGPNPSQPDWAKDAGGPSVAAPGGVSNATQEFEPGNYAALCLIPSPDGVPHAAKGMVKPFTVTAAEGPAAQAPEPDVTISLKDFGFDVEGAKAGQHHVRVVNDCQQHHEVFMIKLAEGKMLDDALAALEGSGPPGPPPFEIAGGLQGIMAGDSGQFSANWTPGRYALPCFLPDVNSGAPHIALGMVKEIAVP
ncbi:MAG: hypothetical protein FJ318_02825 [SAR202 cluster bacterium]|nr:hypothetical protein [SAR202 cluster bacterium]